MSQLPFYFVVTVSFGLTVFVDHAGQDEGLKNLMMAWYYAGYYTGFYEGQQKAAGSTS